MRTELQEYLAAQLEREVIASRKVIERIPEGRNSWKPHPKSMELGYLAALVAGMPGWLAMMIDYGDVDLDGMASLSERKLSIREPNYCRRSKQGLTNPVEHWRTRQRSICCNPGG